jgi:deoxyribodipyrimidine photolyase-like uncharacterized protein
VEWHPCLECFFNHPWPTGDRACPNIGLTREQILRSADRIRSGQATVIMETPLDERKRLQARERMRRMRERQKEKGDE